MLVENNETTRAVRDVAATMAIEDMPLSEEYVKELISAAENEKDYDEFLQEVIKKHAR